jgi:hypothetical protein
MKDQRLKTLRSQNHNLTVRSGFCVVRNKSTVHYLIYNSSCGLSWCELWILRCHHRAVQSISGIKRLLPRKPPGHLASFIIKKKSTTNDSDGRSQYDKIPRITLQQTKQSHYLAVFRPLVWFKYVLKVKYLYMQTIVNVYCTGWKSWSIVDKTQK